MTPGAAVPCRSAVEALTSGRARADPTSTSMSCWACRARPRGAEIRRAYRSWRCSTTPTAPGAASAETFARIAEAYRMLSDPTARTAYDAHLLARESQDAFAPGGAPSDGLSWNVSAVGWNASWRTADPEPARARCRGRWRSCTASGAARLDRRRRARADAERGRGGARRDGGGRDAAAVLCPTCGGVASPRGVWCRRCEYAGTVTETVAVEVPIPRAVRDGVS